MRAMPIRVYSRYQGWKKFRKTFHKNYKHYLQEALGLGIFMISACLFSVLLFAEASPLVHKFSFITRNCLMGILMGATALFIFYSRWTAPSGSHINPAVTITFWRLNRISGYDAFCFAIFQFVGGTIAVVLLQLLLGHWLTHAPVNSAATIPGRQGTAWAAFTEVFIAFSTMSVVLFSSDHEKLKRYTRLIVACLVCSWVIIAGPVSGFGMNPARSFASALPSGIWTDFWIYLIAPIAGMLLAAQLYLVIKRQKAAGQKKFVRIIKKTGGLLEPLEFLL